MFLKQKSHLVLKSLFLTIILTNNAFADGFLSKLLGGAKAASFESMLSHVPADTAFIFSNKKPIPEEVMKFHLNRSQEMMSMFASATEKAKTKKELKGPDAFITALVKDLGEKVTEGKIEESGLSLKARYLIYGYNMLPVIRLSFADKDKLMATIKNAEEKSDYKVELSKCGGYDCFLNTDKNSDKSIAIVVLDNQLAISLFTPDLKDSIIKHLSGEADPKESYTEKRWDEFLAANKYSGFGDGFINLKSLYTQYQPTIAEVIKANTKKKIDNKELNACMAVVKEHIDNVPEIIFGTKNLEAKKMDYELVVKTSTGVSKVLQTIANKTNIEKHIESSVIDFGVNINFVTLKDALTQYSNFLVKSGQTHKCQSIKPSDIRKGMGGMMLAMNMGLTQFKSVYASITDVKLGNGMMPEKVDAFISIGADNPEGLLGMVSMMSPKLMGFQVPADGSAVKLPDGAIPSKGLPLPPIYLSRSEKSLNIMVNNDKPILKTYSNAEPEIMSFSMDGKRYYKIFANIIKMIPQKKASDQEDIGKMMEAMGTMSGSMQQEVTADERGLVINYHMQYQ